MKTLANGLSSHVRLQVRLGSKAGSVFACTERTSLGPLGRVSSKQALHAKNASANPSSPCSLTVTGGRLRLRDWPSIVPGTPEDYYVVVNHYGRFGAAFAETDLDRANYETTIADLMSGQHSDPLRVIMFNPDTNRVRGCVARYRAGNTAPSRP